MTLQDRLSSNFGAKFAVILFAGFLFLRNGGMLFSAQEQEITLDDIFSLMPRQMVTAAARHPQSVKDSPSAITVIPAEEIRVSGAISVPQLLRSVAGLNVAQSSASEWAVTSRQNIEFPGTGVLTMIDGRVVYMDIFSMVPWQALPINMEDIARIEIVKSPSSALWGANAMDGIINIVTKSPAESIGTEVDFRMGDGGEQWNAFSHAGRAGPWGYRFSGGYSAQPQFPNPILGRTGADTASHMANGNAQVVYSAREGKRLTMRAGASDGRGEILSAIGHKDREGGIQYAQVLQEWDNWRLQGYYNGEDVDLLPFGSSRAECRSDIYVAELQNSIPWRERHLFTWGAEGRYDRSHSPKIIGHDRTESRGAVFIQEEYKPWNQLQLSAGGRYDYFAALKDFPTARFGAVWNPQEDHTFRVSAGRSFNKPDAIRLYSNLILPSSLSEVNPSLPNAMYNISIKGDKHLVPARVDAVEVGYQNDSFSRLTARVDAFLKRQKGGMRPVVTSYYPVNAFFPGSPGGVIPASLAQYNDRHNKTWGGEVSLDWTIRHGLICFANYSLQRQSGMTLGQDGPLNKVNAGAHLRLSRLSLYGAAHYVDVRRFQPATQLNPIHGSLSVPSYIAVDARLGYKLTPRVELSVSGSNILNDVHREYADGDYIERRVLGGISVEF